MSNIIIYNAGPLFTEADQIQRIYEEKQFDLIEGVEVFNPLTSPKNKGAISAKMIYDIDCAAIQRSNVFFFDLANNDSGTLVELGMVIQKLEDGRKVEVYPVISDFRVNNRGEYNCEYPPVGYNSFLIGSLEKHNIKIYNSFKDALKAFRVNNNLKNKIQT